MVPSDLEFRYADLEGEVFQVREDWTILHLLEQYRPEWRTKQYNYLESSLLVPGTHQPFYSSTDLSQSVSGRYLPLDFCSWTMAQKKQFAFFPMRTSGLSQWYECLYCFCTLNVFIPFVFWTFWYFVSLHANLFKGYSSSLLVLAPIDRSFVLQTYSWRINVMHPPRDCLGLRPQHAALKTCQHPQKVLL